VFCQNCGGQIPSQESKFCPACGKSINIYSNAISADSSTQIPKKKKGGTGKIIGGVILIIFGLIPLGIGLAVYNNQNQNLEYCNSFVGSFSQIDPENASICQAAPQYITLGIIGGLIGFILLIIGLIILAVGIKQKV
jgi:uncharacterized membrane protein YvbJ